LAYFLDGKLYVLLTNYGNQIEWKGIEQFVEQFSKAMGLRTKWDGYSEKRTLSCHTFVVSAEITANHPSVMIHDKSAYSKVQKRLEQLKSPASFRP
jgi:hypothetical protein